jgi:dTDP-4-amino-4,6-dideoxygalactose transaminase
MSRPDIGDNELEAVSVVLKSDHLSMGPCGIAFEAAFSRLTGTAHALSVSSGTAGLHICVVGAGVGVGDLVVTTPFSFVASSNACLYVGAMPVFVDVEEQTGNMDMGALAQMAEILEERKPAALRRVLPEEAARHVYSEGGALKGILPVHVFGQPADLDPLMETARRFQLRVIEDACEAVGAEYKGRKVGSFGDCGVFAFYPNKQMTTGEGGMVVTDDPVLASAVRSLRNQGRSESDSWLEHSQLGFNYRMDEMSAALGCAQLGRIEELLSKRERVASWYEERLLGVDEIRTPFVSPITTRMSWFTYGIRCADRESRDMLQGYLAEQGVPTRIYFSPIHLQPIYRERFGYGRGYLPKAEQWGDTVLTLPFSGVMTESEVDYVCSHIVARAWLDRRVSAAG